LVFPISKVGVAQVVLFEVTVVGSDHIWSCRPRSACICASRAAISVAAAPWGLGSHVPVDDIIRILRM
jgi:hypothetical protein